MEEFMRRWIRPLLLTVALSAATAASAPQPILDYIAGTWSVLTRSHQQLAAAAIDPKFLPDSQGRWPVFIPATENAPAIEHQLRQEMDPRDFGKIRIETLPADPSRMNDQGLLYLPKSYVVPGGRFNEMYGWDSYFIQLGLLRDRDLDLARDMADNFLYEIADYGKILNANRSYYLSRSQPPFLTEMLMGVFAQTKDSQWLSAALPRVESYYRFWTEEPHLTPQSGLSRYFDLGEGPAPEVLSSERDAQGRTHYDLVKDYFRDHDVTDYDVSQYYDRKTDQLKPLFFKGDRSMRESGFDPSNRFGPFNIDIIHYNPVCLNSLLYLMESQVAEILESLGRAAEAPSWRTRAKERAARINQFMWNAKNGLYCDYNFVRKATRHYPFLTTFYPLWAGIATREQAAAVQANLPLFEQPGGLQTSTFHSGNQWDAPFGWAPLEMIAIEGLRRYGFEADANRISVKWLSMIRDEYERRGIIVEKYDVVHRGLEVSAGIKYGYRSNEIGFGWTNAVFTRLYDALPEPKKRELLPPAVKTKTTAASVP